MLAVLKIRASISQLVLCVIRILGGRLKLTLQECLSLASFRGAKIVAGANKKDVVIRGATSLEAISADDINEFFPCKNHIFLTAFMGIRDDVKAQCEVVEALGNLEDVALAIFYVGKVVDRLHPSVILTAEKAGVPLIQMGDMPHGSMVNVEEDLQRALFYGTGEQFDNNLIPNTIYHLLNFEKYVDFPTALRAAAISNGFQFVLLSQEFNPVLTVETRYHTSVERAIRIGRKQEVDSISGVYTMVDVDDVLTYWGPVTIDGETYYVLIVDNNDSYTAAEITKLAEIIEMGMGMWKFSPGKDVCMEFLKAVRRGNLSVARATVEDAEIDEASLASAFIIDMEDMHAKPEEVEDLINNESFSVIYTRDSDEIYGLCKDAHKLSDCTEIYEELKEFTGLKLFHITPIRDVDDACEAFRMMNEVRPFAEVVYPYKRLLTQFEMAMLSNCINIRLKRGGLYKQYERLLEPLASMTSVKSKQLMKTLETYVLDTGMDANMTGDIMNVHANTVQYRIKKIGEMLAGDFMVNRALPGLTIALALKRLEDNLDE